MERNRDLPRATVSGVNGLPRRRQRITTLRNSPEEDRQMELQETVRLRDRERLQKKDRDRDFPKRRRVDRSTVHQKTGGAESYRENESTDSSDEEYYEEEEEVRVHQQNQMNLSSPASSCLPNNRRSLRSLRSSPVLKAAADELFGVQIPRRARSASARRLNRCWNSSSGEFKEDIVRRRFSPSPIVPAAVLPSPSGVLLKKKKSVERRTRVLNTAPNSRLPTVNQDDIEIEVAEALFDLMKQSQSQSQFSKRAEMVDTDSSKTADSELLKILKAESGGDENSTFSVQNEQSVKVNDGTIMVDSVKEPKKDEKVKFQDDSAQKPVSGNWFVKKGKAARLKESESPSRVKVNACEIQDPTMTKADRESIVVETKKEAKYEIDLMAPPPLPSSPERVMTQDVQKKSDSNWKNDLTSENQLQEKNIENISSNQLSNLDLEKHHGYISCGSNGIKQQQRCRREENAPTSFLPFPVAMSGWPGFLPQRGYMMPHVQTVLPLEGSARSPMAMQPPQFKFSEHRPRRCATHQFIAQNIHHHQQLINKSLLSAPAGAAGAKPSIVNSISSTHEFFSGNPLLGDFQGDQSLGTNSARSGKDKATKVASAPNATMSNKLVLQQAPCQTPASNFLHGPAIIFPHGHDQTTTVAPAVPSGPRQSGSAIGPASHSANSTLPGEAAAVSFNSPNLPSSEAVPYMAMLQNGGSPVPLNGGKQALALPFFNSSFYSSAMFNVSQCQQQLSLPHTFVQSISQNTSASSSHKPPKAQQQSSNKTSGIKFPTSGTAHSKQAGNQIPPSTNSGQTCSFAVPPMNFCYANNKHADPQQQGSKSRVELIPQAFALSFGPNASTTPVLNFSSMAQSSAIFQMLPQMAARNGDQMAAAPFQTAAQQKYFQAFEGKIANIEDGVKSIPGKSPSVSTKDTSTIDSRAQSVNFVPGKQQPFPTMTNFQQHRHQQQLIQLQKHHLQQIQMMGTATQVKASTNSSNFPSNNNPLFAPVSVQSDDSSRSSQLENLSRTDDISKQLKGQTHISFGNNSVSAAGQQIVINS